MLLDRKQFEGIYSRYRESGLTVNDFCSKEGLCTRNFYYRQKRIRSSSHPLVSNGFLALSIDPPADPASGSPGTENRLEITYPEGTVLRLHGNIPAEDILTLLKKR
jgi:hypothetical protein